MNLFADYFTRFNFIVIPSNAHKISPY